MPDVALCWFSRFTDSISVQQITVLWCRFCSWPRSQVHSVVLRHSVKDQTLHLFCPLPLEVQQCCQTCHFVWLSDRADWIQNKTPSACLNWRAASVPGVLLFSDLCANVSFADHRWGGNPVYDQLPSCSDGEHPTATHQHPGLLDCAPWWLRLCSAQVCIQPLMLTLAATGNS